MGSNNFDDEPTTGTRIALYAAAVLVLAGALFYGMATAVKEEPPKPPPTSKVQ